MLAEECRIKTPSFPAGDCRLRLWRRGLFRQKGPTEQRAAERSELPMEFRVRTLVGRGRRGEQLLQLRSQLSPLLAGGHLPFCQQRFRRNDGRRVSALLGFRVEVPDLLIAVAVVVRV